MGSWPAIKSRISFREATIYDIGLRKCNNSRNVTFIFKIAIFKNFVMKKVISFVVAPSPKLLSLGLLILRVLVGITMLTHGLAKLTSFSELSETFPDPIGLGRVLSLMLIIGAEVGCSLFIIVGAFTRLATIPLIFSMLVVIFVVHGSDPFQMVKELPLLYLGIYILLFFSGAGKISLDTLISRKVDVNIRK